MPETDHYLLACIARDVRRTQHGLEAELGAGRAPDTNAGMRTERLRIDVVRSDVVRIAISRGGHFEQTPTSSVCVDPLAEPVAFDLAEEAGRYRLSTETLSVLLSLDPFDLEILRADRSSVLATSADEAGRHWVYATLNDAFTTRRRCLPEDSFYGLGEKGGAFDRKRRDFVLWNTDVLSPHASAPFTASRAAGDPRADRRSPEFDPFYISIPLLYHQDATTGAMCASFIDNPYRADYDFTRSAEYRVHFSGGQYLEYVFVGPDMPQILAAYTWLTGRPPLPPLWALGYHQCRWFEYTQQTFEALAERHRELDLPVDALWLDIEHMDGYRVFTWDQDRFPDPSAMLQRLADQGVRVVTIVDPGVKHEPGYSVFDQALERDVLCRTEGGDVYIGQVWPGDTAFPDFATADARRWWGELNAVHVAGGVSGIWNDMNEPATGSIPPERMRFDRGRASHERYHNQYALLMAMATVKGLRAARPYERTFVLSRAGSPGIQRYAANWMGDNLSRWDHLAVGLSMAAGLGVSGQPFVGADIGGFQGDTDPELFVRWMQYGVLTPFCRNHNEIGYVDQYLWSSGPVVLELMREALRLRYRLMPYLYAAFLHACENGAPVQRPLVFDHQSDPICRNRDDEFLLGPDLLVAPVLSAGATHRQVYLPAGHWYDWHGAVRDAPVPGEGFQIAATPMDRIPIYARAGSLIPMWPVAPQTAGGHHPHSLELHLFLPAVDGDWSSLLQEDDGVSLAALDGARVRTVFATTRQGGSVRVRATVTGSGYPQFERTAFHLVVHGTVLDEVVLDGQPVAGENNVFHLPNRGEQFHLELEM